ncbi:MAG TPA: hypothetical protein VLH94_02140 [Spirochaetia bacterium]|nr:hypothetical protein [Spirochaetia bacterium]
MINPDHVSIYLHYISWDVIIPERYVQEFMEEVNKEFARGNDQVTKIIGTVNSFSGGLPKARFVNVTTLECLRKHLHRFIQEFCTKRNLQFDNL